MGGRGGRHVWRLFKKNKHLSVCSSACWANSTLQLDRRMRVSKNSMRSSCVGTENGPRLTTASISGHLLLCRVELNEASSEVT